MKSSTGGKWTLTRPDKAPLEFDQGATAIEWVARNRKDNKGAKLYDPEGKLILTVGQPSPN